jgi:hypothetical protein
MAAAENFGSLRWYAHHVGVAEADRGIKYNTEQK